MGCASRFDLVRVKAEMLLPGLIAGLLLRLQWRCFIGIGEEDARFQALLLHGWSCRHAVATPFEPVQASFQLLNSLLQPVLVILLAQELLQRLGQADSDPLGALSHGVPQVWVA